MPKIESYIPTLDLTSSRLTDLRLAVYNPATDSTEGITVESLLSIMQTQGLLSGWRDYRSSVAGLATGAGSPTLAAFGPSGTIKQLSFGVGDSVYAAIHVDHDVKVGSTMYPHVHWATNGTSTNTVKWEINYTIAKGHNQESFSADQTINLEEAAQGTAWRHMVTEDTVGFTAPEVDSLIIVEMKRVTNGGSENADTVFGLFFDIHYESQQYATPNRSPDFYA